ncbi:MAG TPA: DUF4214 domain-containing protein [Gemmataceae bacterium]|nr:DUF4214 domain-containing protein [Gemmataceae bacterium]
MTRTLVLSLAVLLVATSLASAQSYSYRPATPGDPATLNRSNIKGYLRREPTPRETSSMQDLRGGSPEYVKSAVLAGDEYFERAGGTRPAYVRQLYVDVLGREPLPAEINYWVGRLRYEPRRDVAYRLLRLHPQNASGMTPVRPSYNPGFFPDPASPAFPDPSGPYFHTPYFFNYEKSREIRAFPLSAQG